MPWTRQQVKYLESSGSPLSAAQKDKMNAELHANPAMGHMKKGSSAMKHELHHMEIHPAENGGHTVQHHYKMKSAGKSGAFMERAEPEAHAFGPEQHAAMMKHIAKHLTGGLKAEATEVAKEEAAEEDEG